MPDGRFRANPPLPLVVWAICAALSAVAIHRGGHRGINEDNFSQSGDDYKFFKRNKRKRKEEDTGSSVWTATSIEHTARMPPNEPAGSPNAVVQLLVVRRCHSAIMQFLVLHESHPELGGVLNSGSFRGKISSLIRLWLTGLPRELLAAFYTQRMSLSLSHIYLVSNNNFYIGASTPTAQRWHHSQTL